MVLKQIKKIKKPVQGLERWLGGQSACSLLLRSSPGHQANPHGYITTAWQRSELGLKREEAVSQNKHQDLASTAQKPGDFKWDSIVGSFRQEWQYSREMMGDLFLEANSSWIQELFYQGSCEWHE